MSSVGGEMIKSRILSVFFCLFLILSLPIVIAEEFSLTYDANGNLLKDNKNFYVLM